MILDGKEGGAYIRHMWMPSPSEQELIAEHIAARAPIKMTAKALGIKPKELAVWWRWLDKWAPLVCAA